MSEHEPPSAGSGDGQATPPTADVPADDGAASRRVDPVDSPDADFPEVSAPTAAVDLGASPSGDMFQFDSQDTHGDERSVLRRPRNLALIGSGVAVLVLTAVFGPVACEMWSRDDVRISTPQRVAGLALDDSQGAHDTIEYLRTAVQTAVSLQKSTGAVYADDAGQSRSVLFVGGTGEIGSAENALTKTFQLISDDNGGVEHVRTVPAGPLGGTMKCGSTQTDGATMAVCGWADRHSLGIAMFPNRTVDQSAELLRTMRASIQEGR